MEKLREGQRARSCYCLGQTVCPAALWAFEERSLLGVLGGKSRQAGFLSHCLCGLTEALGWFCPPGEKDRDCAEEADL